MLTKENLWQRIKENEGNVFYTVKQKKAFTYKVFSNYIVTSLTKESIYHNSFKHAYEIGAKKPCEINKNTNGASYIVAILNDPRITF